MGSQQLRETFANGVIPGNQVGHLDLEHIVEVLAVSAGGGVVVGECVLLTDEQSVLLDHVQQALFIQFTRLDLPRLQVAPQQDERGQDAAHGVTSQQDDPRVGPDHRPHPRHPGAIEELVLGCDLPDHRIGAGSGGEEIDVGNASEVLGAGTGQDQLGRVTLIALADARRTHHLTTAR